MSETKLKRCPRCKKEFPRTDEYFYFHSRPGHQAEQPTNLCKTCHNQHSRELTKIRNEKKVKASSNGHSKVSQEKLAVMIPDIAGTWEQCGSCGTMKGNIIGDVDEITGEKYGYLCMKCYRLVHDFGKEPDRMRKAIDYVEKTRVTRVAHKKMPTMAKT